MRIVLIPGLAAGLFAMTVAPSATLAQTSYRPAPQAAPAAPQAQQSRSAQRAAERERERQEKIQRRATKLRQALQLRPDQEGALMSYMQVIYPAGRDDDGPSTRNMNTPQKLDVEYNRRVQRLNEWRREADAAKQFYNTLSAPQRAAADATDLFVD